jgi:hypothetical protein
MKLKMTFLNQMYALFDLMLISCLYFCFWFFNLEIFSSKFILYLGLPFFIIFAVPVIIIHLNYYFASAKTVYLITEQHFEVIYKNKSVKYNIKDVNKAVVIKTPNKLKDSAVRSFSFENYYYIKLQLVNGKTLIMTCLHSNKIDKIIEDHFKEIEVIKIKSIFPLIKNGTDEISLYS